MLSLDVSVSFYPFQVNFTSIEEINGFLNFFLSYFLAPLLVNYLFIFRRQRYKKLLDRYPPRNGRYFATYFIGSIGFLLAYFLIGFIYVTLG